MQKQAPDSDIPQSKSRLKREAQDLQTLGASLVALTAARLVALNRLAPVPPKLLEAIVACRTITAREGKRRQLQYIGRLMRAVDAEPLRRALTILTMQDRVETLHLHELEQWRERLLNEGDPALQALLQEYPQADGPRLRSLIAQALAERRQAPASRAARVLFRYLRSLIEQAPSKA